MRLNQRKTPSSAGGMSGVLTLSPDQPRRISKGIPSAAPPRVRDAFGGADATARNESSQEAAICGRGVGDVT
jgi:hypothetical protein